MSSLPLFFSFSLWLQWTDTFFKEEQYKYSLEWYFMSLETESRYFLWYFCTRVEVLISSNTCTHARCLCIELKATDNDFRENQSSKSLNITERKWMGENQMSTTKMKSNKTQAFLFIGICHHRVLVWCRAVSCCRGRRRGSSVWKIDHFTESTRINTIIINYSWKRKFISSVPMARHIYENSVDCLRSAQTMGCEGLSCCQHRHRPIYHVFFSSSRIAPFFIADWISPNSLSIKALSMCFFTIHTNDYIY